VNPRFAGGSVGAAIGLKHTARSEDESRLFPPGGSEF